MLMRDTRLQVILLSLRALEDTSHTPEFFFNKKQTLLFQKFCR